MSAVSIAGITSSAKSRKDVEDSSWTRSPVPAGWGVVYSDSVSKDPGPGALSGTVSFTADGTPIQRCSGLHLSLGTAACPASVPIPGSYSAEATYAADPRFVVIRVVDPDRAQASVLWIQVTSGFGLIAVG
jgi:hypothetical protein